MKKKKRQMYTICVYTRGAVLICKPSFVTLAFYNEFVFCVVGGRMGGGAVEHMDSVSVPLFSVKTRNRARKHTIDVSNHLWKGSEKGRRCICMCS